MKRSRINLIPPDLRREKTLRTDHFIYALGLMMLIFVGAHWRHNQLKNRELEEATLKLSQLNESLKKEIANIKNAARPSGRATAQALQTLDEVLKKKSGWSEPLKELSGVIPNGVWLTRLSSANDKTGEKMVLIAGSAESEQKVSQFFSALEQSYWFRHVIIRFSERQTNVVPRLYSFEFSAPLLSSSKAGGR